MTTHYLTDLMEKSDATDHGSFKMLVPNGGPIPNRVCRMCDHYRDGGICDKAKRGVTSALEPADAKQCFVPIGLRKSSAPVINDTPEVRAADKRRRTRTSRWLRNEVTHKVCVACGRDLPLDAFEPSKGKTGRAVGGVMNECRECKEARLNRMRKSAKRVLNDTTLVREEKVADPVTGRKKPGRARLAIPTHKVCVTCGRDLPMDAFPVSKQKDKKDGHCDQCIECRTARYASRSPYKTEDERKEARRRTNNACWHRKSERMKAEREAAEADGMRTCKCCGKSKPLEEFTRTRGGVRMHTCKECMVEKWKRGGRNRWKGKAPQQVTLQKEAPKIASVDVVPVEQVKRTIDKARDKALALGLDKVAQCLAEAADSIRELAANFEGI